MARGRRAPRPSPRPGPLGSGHPRTGLREALALAEHGPDGFYRPHPHPYAAGEPADLPHRIATGSARDTMELIPPGIEELAGLPTGRRDLQPQPVPPRLRRLAREFRAEADLPAQQSRDEMDSLQECVDAITGLEEAARRRVVRYLNGRFDT